MPARVTFITWALRALRDVEEQRSRPHPLVERHPQPLVAREQVGDDEVVPHIGRLGASVGGGGDVSDSGSVDGHGLKVSCEWGGGGRPRWPLHSRTAVRDRGPPRRV